MNALLIITILALQDDGAVTRQRDLIVWPSMEICRAHARELSEALRAIEPPPISAELRCVEMATLEVVKPPSKPQPERAPGSAS